MSEISISAIIVTHNSAESILNCLVSLNPQLKRLGGEIIIYDNHSTDATVSAIRSRFPDIKIQASPKNIGFGAACNNAAQSASGRYLLFANPDLVFDSNVIIELIQSSERIPDCGLVSARLRYPDGDFQPNCRQLPTMKNLFLSRGSFLQKVGFVRDTGQYTLPDFDTVTSVPAASATCALISRDFFLSLKGFDPRFFLFMEDTDLCHRISLAGKKVYFVPQAGAIHNWGRGAGISERRRVFHQHISVWKYFLKYYPNGFSLLALPLLLAANYLFRFLFVSAKEK